MLWKIKVLCSFKLILLLQLTLKLLLKIFSVKKDSKTKSIDNFMNDFKKIILHVRYRRQIGERRHKNVHQ